MSSIVVTRRLPGGVAVEGAWTWDGDGPIPPDLLREEAMDARGVLTMLTDPIDAGLLDAAPGLRVVSQMAVGVDNIDVDACTARGIPVGHTPDVLTETTADTAWALLSAAVRRIPEGADVVRSGRWGEWDPEFLLGGDLHGTVLGIVGLGRIGSAVARRAAGFGMTVLYTGPRRLEEREREVGASYRSLEALLAESDHVVVAAPLTPTTHHLLDRSTLAMMRPGSTLVNVARGGLVDHEALVDALRAGCPARAALDVTEPEPIPTDHPLVAMPECLIVPHIGSASVRTRTAMARLAVDNLVAGLAGERLRCCANPEVYR